VTLRGQVLPVGGIKQKVLAAHRAGLHTVILPARNSNDLDDIPESVRADMRFVLVDRVEDVLHTVFSSEIETAGEAVSAAEALGSPVGYEEGANGLVSI